MRIPLKGILTREQEGRGYRLLETEDFVELWRKDTCVAVFSSSGVTATRLREEADKDWERRNDRTESSQTEAKRSLPYLRVN